MAYNVNDHDTKQFGFGPWTLLIGPFNPTAAGGTPSGSVGAVADAMQLNPVRDVVPVLQGVPAKEVDAFVSGEHLDVVFTGIQWNLPMLHRGLGGGSVPTVSSETTTFNFGGDVLMTQLALQGTHRLPNGSTVILNAWKVRGNGTVPVSIPPDNVHQQSYTFTLVEGLSDWTNTVLSDKEKLWQMQYIEAP